MVVLIEMHVPSSSVPRKRRAVRGNFCCTRSVAFRSSAQLFLPLAGLVPATHVFLARFTGRQEDVDAHGTSPWAEGPRAKPGQGGSNVVQTTLRTTVFGSP